MRAVRAETIRSLAEGLADLYCPDGRVDPLRILEAAGITISYNHYGDAFEGALEHNAGRFHAYCNLDKVRSKNSPRARFTIAHELGHYHIDEHRAALKRGLAPMHGSFANRPDSEIIVEQEADLFASHLLLPRPRYHRLVARLPFQPTGLHKITAVAQELDVSVQATARRYCQETSDTCGLVMWRTEDQPWAFISPSWERRGYLHLRRDPAAIMNGSATYRAKEAASDNSKGRFGSIEESASTAAFWFSNVPHGGQRDVVLVEQAVRLGSFGVLTLLLIKA
jgi:hypothetical protein